MGQSRQASVVGPGEINLSLGFSGHAARIQNNTGYWYYVPTLDHFIPPLTFGDTVFYDGGQTFSVVHKVPSIGNDVAIFPAASGTLTVVVYEDAAQAQQGPGVSTFAGHAVLVDTGNFPISTSENSFPAYNALFTSTLYDTVSPDNVELNPPGGVLGRTITNWVILADQSIAAAGNQDLLIFQSVPIGQLLRVMSYRVGFILRTMAEQDLAYKLWIGDGIVKVDITPTIRLPQQAMATAMVANDQLASWDGGSGLYAPPLSALSLGLGFGLGMTVTTGAALAGSAAYGLFGIYVGKP